MSDPIDLVAGSMGREYGMTAEQMLQHMALGDVPHPDAPDDVCGATDPRDDSAWCVRPPGHDSSGHNRYVP